MFLAAHVFFTKLSLGHRWLVPWWSPHAVFLRLVKHLAYTDYSVPITEWITECGVHTVAQMSVTVAWKYVVSRPCL